uniref:Menorin-like domain-containing protein n=1 Tax=Esox lucius TaxID=8010 RepID=A0A3P8ZNB1_ESOLU
MSDRQYVSVNSPTVFLVHTFCPIYPYLEAMKDQTLEHFLRQGKIRVNDAADIQWAHAANSKTKITEALQSSAHMIEADILLRGHEPKEPIMAHPPENDSDISLHDWLKVVQASDKGIKLDFKSLQAVAPSMALLDSVRSELRGPVWINADILPGPGGKATPLDPKDFVEAAVTPGSYGDVLSLGWTTGWVAGTENPGYSWEMVREMEAVCWPLTQSVTFPVRAALMSQSFPQLQWLLQQSDRYSLTVWTGQTDALAVEDLLPYRKDIDKTRIYYDLLDAQRAQLRGLPGF